LWFSSDLKDGCSKLAGGKKVPGAGNQEQPNALCAKYAQKTAELPASNADKGTDHMIQKGKGLATAAREPHLSQSQNPSEPGLDRNVQARIGDNLRAMYDELLQQPVPDRFRDLLGQFEKQSDRKEQGR
jgi:hypothetical protein